MYANVLNEVTIGKLVCQLKSSQIKKHEHRLNTEGDNEWIKSQY